MKHILPIIFATLFFTACTQMTIQPPSGDHPIDTIIPPQGTPQAVAWHDSETLTMGLDTGAVQESLLFSPSAKSLGGRIRGKGPMQTTRLSISLTKDGDPITDRQDVVMTNSAPYDGLLGWKTIRQYVWNLNYPKGTHQFYTSIPPRVKKWDHLHLVKGSDFAQVKDKTGRRIIIDTGAPYALYISKKHWSRFKLDYPDAVVSVDSGFSPAAGGYYTFECMRIKSYKIGDLELMNIVACESFADKNILNIDKDIDIILGIGAFYGREFWLDGPNNTLYFSSRRPTIAESPAFNSVGATFIPQANGLPPLTAKVAPWSTAWHSGLRTGDILVAINDIKHPDNKFLEYYTSQPGANATVEVRRKNRHLLITWTVPEIPEPGEYHPTPEAVTEEVFEQHMIEQNRLEQAQQQNDQTGAKASVPAVVPEQQ